ncbi:hypothetical protein F2Q69_00058616 [Brassica cretica]|uniref:Uncharacterized protein n=1 Tax=Brassica cretica TaxID=69181 RepID=A0A8S9RAX9_BRACR|nr:hypothetical protein F2Q69_00058616 [Brassica cretica]
MGLKGAAPVARIRAREGVVEVAEIAQQEAEIAELPQRSRIQQQVEDDAEVYAIDSENPETKEDGEVNEDASNKPVKFTKKRGRGNKEPNVDTSKSKRQKKQEDSVGDVIGRVLEDLEKTD